MSDENKQDIASAVLTEQVKGLIKTTDIQFSQVKDSLSRIEQNNLGYATKTEVEERVKDIFSSIRRIEDNQAKHNEDDIKSFGGISKQVGFLTKTIWMAMGGLSVLVFVLHFLFKF